MDIVVTSINQTFGEDGQTSQIIVALNGSSTDGSGDYFNSSVNVTSKDLPSGSNFDTILDGEIETLAHKKLANYVADSMPIRVSSITRNYDQQTHEITSDVVFLRGNATDGSGDYINYRVTITKADLPTGKTFETMTVGDLKALAKAKLVALTKVA